MLRSNLAGRHMLWRTWRLAGGRVWSLRWLWRTRRRASPGRWCAASRATGVGLQRP